MSEQTIAEAVELGRENQRATLMLANHCVHARVEMPGGTSMVGAMYGVPIGRAEVRCEHAPASSRTMAMQVMDLAVAFYEAHCTDCPFRQPNGLLPTIAVEVERRRTVQQEAHRRAEADFMHTHDAWERRFRARRSAVAAEGYPVRDLADDLDAIDAEPHRVYDTDRTAAEAKARRRLVETARRAPKLFNEVLVDTVRALATDRYDDDACAVLRLLARAGVVPTREAARIGAEVLAARPVPAAGQLVAELAGELAAEHIGPACAGAITLAGDDDDGFSFRRRPAEPAALMALAGVDLPTVTAAVTTALGADDDQRRADGAEAARYLLQADPSRVVALGEPLVRSIHGEDGHFAGQPEPGASAAKALAEAWRGAPTTTAQIIDATAGMLTVEAREELIAVLHFLRRWDDGTAIPPDAVATAVAFALRRLDGRWGGRTADEATDQLLALARDYPDTVVDSTEALVAALLAECQPLPQPSALLDEVPADPLAHLQRLGDEMGRNGRRGDLADAIGALGAHAPERVLPSVLALLGATTGNTDADSVTRAALIRALARTVTAATVRSMLPTLYTCLLSDDQVVRGSAVELWQACARVTSTLPSDLAALAPTLLADPYVVVHRAMLRSLPSLELPKEAAGDLLTLLMNIADVYRAKDDKQPLEDALNDVLWSASQCDDAVSARDAALFVVAASTDLHCYRCERLLLDRRVAWMRASAVWAVAVLRTLADRQRPDRFNQRDDKLLAALLAEPRGLVTVPYAQFRAAADIHLPDFVKSAAEPIELLQSAGRWADAARLAEDIADAIPDTAERRFARYYLRALAAAAAAEAAAVTGEPPPPLPDPLGDAKEPAVLVHARGRATARAALTPLPSANPAAAADTITRATDILTATPGGDRRAAAHIKVLRIAVHLLRHDAAVRTAATVDAAAHLAAARREADVLASFGDDLADDDPIRQFAALVPTVTSDTADAALTAAAAIPVALPLSDHAFRRSRTGDLPVSPSPAAHAVLANQGDTPTAVCVLSLDEDPVVDVVVMRNGYAYDLTLDMRLDHWPDWADTCQVELLSTLPVDAMTRPEFTFTRDDLEQDDHGIRLSRTGTLLCRTERRAGREALDLPLHVRFTGSDGANEVALVAGYRRLRLRPYDPSRDALTTHSQIDQRLLELYDPLHDDVTLDPDDVAAFCRLFTACVRAAQAIMFDSAFRSGRKISEQQFHDALEERLRRDPELEGRLTRRDPVAGGFDDLLHDDVIAELKVEKTTPRTVEDCAKYIGQPTQYGVGRGSRLSILVVLDHSRKAAPPAVLENYIGWMHPAHHGLDDPRYPSRVGVLIINTNWPVPSGWSRRQVQLRHEPEAST